MIFTLYVSTPASFMHMVFLPKISYMSECALCLVLSNCILPALEV